MIKVRCCAFRIKPGDVLNGERVQYVIPHPGRDGKQITVMTPHRDGYKFRQTTFAERDIVQVKRPKYNLASLGN